MKRAEVLLMLVFGFILFWNSESAPQELTCKDQKVLLDVMVPDDGSSKNLLAAVLIKDTDENVNEGLGLEKYLHRRLDGWTHLSTEKNRVKPGQTISNCLPQGIYNVKVEYYERKPFVGDWPTFSYEFRVSLLRIIFESIDPDSGRLETLSVPAVNFLSAMTKTTPTLLDYIKIYGPLFTIYTLFPLLFLAIIIFVLRLKNKN